MATPNFDYLHLRLSNLINDPVAAASTAGNILSVAQRTDYLNRARLQFIQKICGSIADTMQLRAVLASVLKTQVFVQSLTGTTVNSDYINVPIGLTVTGDTTVYTWHSVKEDLDNFVNSNLGNAYTISDSKIYVYKSGVLQETTSSDTTFYYISGDHCSTAGVAISEGGDTDIALAQSYWDSVCQLAASTIYMELGDVESAQVLKGNV